jgi:hypothetical protein
LQDSGGRKTDLEREELKVYPTLLILILSSSGVAAKADGRFLKLGGLEMAPERV